MDLTLTSRRKDGWSVVHVEGELDIATADQLSDRITRDLERRSRRARLVVDLSDLEFCDASGLRALREADTAARRLGGQLRLAIPEGRVLRVVRLTGLDQVLPVFPTLHDATTSRAPKRSVMADQPA
ncbi:STAS domain-containing protein [Kitasatospora sp. MAP5-34]|uniref:STAS domain-containing protein n=1 Tax=Kitasatospora sp. MAP5-34 TaxID=3035102 RepID=UPI002476D7B9|nr:STAS domain-containing protein [Kitasatospora sp. MAP5-34]MDH6580498.1 anti-sigma B factor antagonist [Kitasatospora sp. MAP5-34]